MATKGIGRPLTILLRADTSGLGKGLQQAQSKLEGYSSKLESVSRKATIAFAGVALGAYSAVQAASSLNESISKSNVIFGDNAKAIQSWAATADKSLGLSQVAAQEAAANFAILGQSAGLTGTDLTGFSKELTTLASDLASFNDTSTDEAITALAAGLRGESEPLRRFGVLLNAGAVEAKAMEMGLAKTSKELTDQDKVLARNALIMEQTTLQQGDFARTAGSAANLQRSLAGTIENTKAKIGTGLLPVYQELLNTLIPVADYFANNSEQVVTLGKVAAITAGSIIALNYAIKAAIVVTNLATTAAAGLRLTYLTLAAATGSATAAQTLAELTYKNVTIASKLYSIAMYAQTAATNAAALGVRGLTLALLANPLTAFIAVVGIAALAVYKFKDSTDVSAYAAKKSVPYYQAQQGSLINVANAANTATVAIAKNAAVTANASMQSRDSARANGRSAQTYVYWKDVLKDFNVELPKAATGVKKLSKAQQKLLDQKEALKDAKKAFKEYANTIRSTINAQIDFGAAFEAKGQGSFIESLRKQADAAKAFAGKIAKLVALGISRGGLDQVLAAGPVVGSAIADELIGGGAAAVQDVNSLIQSVDAIAGNTGKNVSAALGGTDGLGNVNITINGAVDPVGTARTLEKLFQQYGRTIAPVSLVGSTL